MKERISGCSCFPEDNIWVSSLCSTFYCFTYFVYLKWPKPFGNLSVFLFLFKNKKNLKPFRFQNYRAVKDPPLLMMLLDHSVTICHALSVSLFGPWKLIIISTFLTVLETPCKHFRQSLFLQPFPFN